VRWYSKDGKHIHDQCRNVVHVHIDKPPVEDTWHVIELEDFYGIECTNCLERSYNECESVRESDGLCGECNAAIKEAIESLFIVTNKIRIFLLGECGYCGQFEINDRITIQEELSVRGIYGFDDLLKFLSKAKRKNWIMDTGTLPEIRKRWDCNSTYEQTLKL
jgi:hypothetical protein